MKITGGEFRGRRLVAPKTTATRPTSGRLREAVFSMCQSKIEGSRFLDIFAGSGAMGLEAISRGSAHSTLIDNHPEAKRAIYTNINTLGVQDQVKLIFASVERALKKLEGPFDIIYIDPPYGKADLAKKTLEGIVDHKVISPETLIFLEESQRTELSFSCLELQSQRRIGETTLYCLKSS